MRYAKERRVKAKQAILRSASRVLKRDGFNGVGVDGLAASANLTFGGFCSNFATKKALLEEVISAELGAMFAGIGRRRLVGSRSASAGTDREPGPRIGPT